MIILAHSGTPEIIFQVRNFDVPLMVLISGISFSITSKRNYSYGTYILKRIKRLVFPTWTFLAFYFLYLSQTSEGLPELEDIIHSFTLQGGIGYVWIIRVFLLVSISFPFLKYLNDKIDKDFYFLIILISLLYSFEIIRLLTVNNNSTTHILSDIFLYIIPYSIIGFLGIRIISLSSVTTLKYGFVLLIIFLTMAIYYYHQNNDFIQTQVYKYPPGIYYTSYALFVSLFLWFFVNIFGDRFYNNRIIKKLLFLSKNTMWIYLWHIPFVSIIQTNFIVKSFSLFFIASFLMCLQYYIIKKICEKDFLSDKTKKNLRVIFTG